MMFGLDQNTLNRIHRVLFLFPEIKEVILYGSRAKGNYKEGSDIDLTLKGTNLNLDLLNKLSSQLDDLLLPYTFDISIYENIKTPELIEHIERVGKTFFIQTENRAKKPN